MGIKKEALLPQPYSRTTQSWTKYLRNRKTSHKIAPYGKSSISAF